MTIKTMASNQIQNLPSKSNISNGLASINLQLEVKYGQFRPLGAILAPFMAPTNFHFNSIELAIKLSFR